MGDYFDFVLLFFLRIIFDVLAENLREDLREGP